MSETPDGAVFQRPPKPIAEGYKILYSRLDQTKLCAWEYPGAAGTCPREAVGVASSDHGDIPFCDEHMAEGTR